MCQAQPSICRSRYCPLQTPTHPPSPHIVLRKLPLETLFYICGGGLQLEENLVLLQNFVEAVCPFTHPLLGARFCTTKITTPKQVVQKSTWDFPPWDFAARGFMNLTQPAVKRSPFILSQSHVDQPLRGLARLESSRYALEIVRKPHPIRVRIHGCSSRGFYHGDL